MVGADGVHAHAKEDVTHDVEVPVGDVAGDGVDISDLAEFGDAQMELGDV